MPALPGFALAKGLAYVSIFCGRFTVRGATAACLVACLSAWGCSGRISAALPGLPLPPHDVPPSDPAAPPAAPAPSSAAAAGDALADRAILARSIEKDAHGRGLSVWIHAVEGSPEGWRWRYPDLEELLSRPPGQQPDFARYLADNDRVVASNAAIALARCGQPAGLSRLATAAAASDIPLPMRCAAVEAMATLRGAETVERLRELIDRYGRQPRNGVSRYIAELHAEAIRGLARHLDAAADPRFAEALRSPAAEVRREALSAWSLSRRGPLPIEAADLRSDSDVQVRAAALQALATRRYPQALPYVTAALRDSDVRVRIAAIAALGELGGPEAQATLEDLAQKNRSERIRAESIAALVRLGAERPVLDAATDTSWRVRSKVAEALGAWPDRDGVAAARRLLDDPSAEVQHAAVAALAAWPLEQSGPELLTAMAKGGLLTRKTAAAELAARWPPAAEFPAEGPPERRAEVIEHLQAQLRQQHSAVDQAALAGRPTDSVITPARMAQVEQLVERQDTAGLIALGPELPVLLEHLLQNRAAPLPEMIYREVLPRCGPALAALGELQSPDVVGRRRAADRLAELAKRQPLGWLVVERLAQVLPSETDALVWQSTLTAVSGEASEPAIRLAYVAIGHPSPDVRRRACEHLAAHPHPQHAQVLVPALQDASHAVVCAAARALGAGGHMDDTGPLRHLTGSTDEHVQLAAAAALVALGDPAGTAALERVAYSNDPIIQRQAAEAIGQGADPALTATLIRLLDGQASVGRSALESLPKLVGHDVAEEESPPPQGTSERMRRWKQWYQRQTGPTPGS